MRSTAMRMIGYATRPTIVVALVIGATLFGAPLTLAQEAIEPLGTVGGGHGNVAGAGATVGGGEGNTASAQGATVSGGQANTASGQNSIVAGGLNSSTSGDNSFAAGTHAVAQDAGSFVWADDSSTDAFTSGGPNTFQARATGGFNFITEVRGNEPNGCTLDHNSNLTCSGNITAGGSVNASIVNAGTVGLGHIAAEMVGATKVFARNVDASEVNAAVVTAGRFVTKSLEFGSDRALKTGFQPVAASQVLARVAALPLTCWTFRGESVRHIGPMAQDFHAAFKVGEDDKHISITDEGGVALAAIQGLYHEVQSKDAQLSQQEKLLAAQAQQIKLLTARLEKLERLTAAGQAGGVRATALEPTW